MKYITNVITFLNENEGAFQLLTSIVTIIVTVHIARKPYKKRLDLTMTLENTFQYDGLCENNLSLDEFHNNFFIVKYYTTNLGSCSLMIRKIVIEQQYCLLFWKSVGNIEFSISKSEFLSPYKNDMTTNGPFKVESNISLNEIQYSKLRVIVYFKGSKKRYKLNNCIKNEINKKKELESNNNG